ncbi:hypothetical protein GOP47_0027324 [Adiantum capillus-veneris]|nr:hypothetical protein GOP47_0027324 [Adiantum capillus-veneris]
MQEQTGGLIIWKSGSAAVLYRGQHYAQPVSEIVDDLLAKKYRSLMSSNGTQEASLRASQKHAANEVGFSNEGHMDSFDGTEVATEQLNSGDSVDDAREHLGDASKQAALKKRTRTSGPEFEKLEEYTMEVDNLLKDLGPRYEEWTGREPLPVDGDLLFSSIPNYSPPYRLLPFGMRRNLGNTKATQLRRLSRPLPPHFVIGRDRGLQGLAAAMVKLWEKSEIAKIGVKRGVLNTSHEIIIEDLKQLTGGFLLSRDKYSITFYRGNDFLPQTISAALADHQTRVEDLQVEEERGRADGSVHIVKGSTSSGAQPSWVHIIDPEEQIRLKKEAARSRRYQVIAHLERKLKMALEKRQKAERELAKVEELSKPVASSDDKEILTDEERFMLKKLGLKMKAFLLLGRRRVFSGVVQNMHLHWKHRELVKIVVKERDPVQLNEMARMLEAESGGTLISIDPTSKGFAIVVYRGKNYARPPELRPPNLLTKRLALRRSLEMQRRESLSRHMKGLEEEIAHLRAGLSKMKMLENSDEPVQSKESNNAHDTLERDGSHESQQNEVLFEDDEEPSVPKLSRWKLERLCEIGPIFKAVRLSKSERHAFRNEILKMDKAPHFLVGRSNPMSAIAKGIRLYFLHHAFVKIGVAYRPRGASVQDVVEELEDLTGGTAYAQDDFRVILYRGWPSGEDMPLGGLYDVISPEQCDILEDDEEEKGEDDNEESVMENTPTQAAEKMRENEERDKDQDAEDEDWDTVSDEEDWDSLSDEDAHDEEANNELRSEAILGGSFVSLDNEADSRPMKVDDEDWDSLSDEDDDEDVHDEDGNDELRSEAILVRNFVRSDDEKADFRSVKVDYDRALAGGSGGVGGDEMALDFDLDEDV